MSTATIPSLSGTYTIDPTHSQIGFGARHAMVTKVRGKFKEFSGSGLFDAESPSNSKIEIIIQAASIDTGNTDRDAHLRGNDFFSMDEFPQITFTSTAFEKKDADSYQVIGDLTVKGVSKSVTLALEFTGNAVDPYNNARIGFEGKTTINRKDWGVDWNASLKAGGVLVGEKVTLEFEISAIRNQEAS